MNKFKILLMTALIFSTTCNAADFVFRVPVNLKELFLIKTVTVTCRVGSDGFSTSQEPGSIEDTFFGSNSITKSVVNDELISVFEVPVNMGENPSNIPANKLEKPKDIINAYYCNTSICTTPSSCGRLTIGNSNPSFKAKPGTQAFSRAYGGINVQSN